MSLVSVKPLLSSALVATVLSMALVASADAADLARRKHGNAPKYRRAPVTVSAPVSNARNYDYNTNVFPAWQAIPAEYRVEYWYPHMAGANPLPRMRVIEADIPSFQRQATVRRPVETRPISGDFCATLPEGQYHHLCY